MASVGVEGGLKVDWTVWIRLLRRSGLFPSFLSSRFRRTGYDTNEMLTIPEGNLLQRSLTRTPRFGLQPMADIDRMSFDVEIRTMAPVEGQILPRASLHP